MTSISPAEPAGHPWDHTAQPAWSLRGWRTVAEFEGRAALADLTGPISRIVIQPLVWTAFVAAGLREVVTLPGAYGGTIDYLAFVIPGILGMLAFASFADVLYRSTIDRRWGLLGLKLVFGTGPLGYVLGMNIMAVGMQIARTLVVLPLILLLGGDLDLLYVLYLALTSLPAVMYWSCIALIATAGIRNYHHRDLIVTLSVMPLTFSAPIFFAMESMPAYLQWIAHINPLTYQITAMRDAFVWRSMGGALAISCGLAAAAVMVSALVVKRADLLPTEH